MRRSRLALLTLVVAAPGFAEATRGRVGETGPERGGAVVVLATVSDTIVWPDLLARRPFDPPGWTTDTSTIRLRLGLRQLPTRWEIPPAPAPAASRAWLLPAGETLASVAIARLRRHVEPGAFVRAALRSRLARPEMRSTEEAFLPAPRALPGPLVTPTVAAGATTVGVRGFVSDYAELGLRVRGSAELGGDWSRFRPCLGRFQEACNPGRIPQLSPDLSFAVQVGGTIAERVHLNVDFDQAREFEAANTINIFYEGSQDEVVQRLEVGDVTFRLPPSRFVTQGVPAGNFGFQATGQVGPLDYQAVWAEQKGDLSSRVFRLSGVGPERGFVQEDTVVVDDADYVRGQFFFLFDPREILDYPHVDVLSLDGSETSSLVAPGLDPIQLYRYDNEPVLRQQVQGFIQADAVAEGDFDTVVESGWFRYLQPGVDYFAHSSGLWVALRNPLREEEMLAVTYLTAVGGSVGDYNPEGIYNAGERPTLRLLKASSANHQPGRPTWDLEMHNVYRVSGFPDVEQSVVGVTISLGELSAGRTFKRGVTGEDVTFLRLLGLDQESPVDEVDPAFVYEPAGEVFQEQPAVQGTFIVFPTLRPFAEPPPLPFLGLSEQDTRVLLGDDANPAIYEESDPFERDNAGRFRITIPFRVRSRGVISSFSLGALGIRDGSERILVGERLMLRGVDYEIDYDVGQVTLLNPETLFAADPDAEVRASWEQKQIFQTAPTSVFGLSGRFGLGRGGALNFMGLYQTEKTLVTRPLLGVEPGAIGLAGISASLGDDVEWLDRLLENVPLLRSAGESRFTVAGEVAVSAPTPNTQGDVFLDDFDATNALSLSLLARDWTRGSAPAFRDGADDILPPALDDSDVVPLVWQHTWIVSGPAGDSLGIHEGFFPRQEIDGQIRFSGSEIREPGLLLTLGEHGGGGNGGPGWAAITTTLSPTGTDLTKSEFLEFYTSGADDAVAIVDLGAVSEDAAFVGPGGEASGLKETGVPWGSGILDHEADPARGEIWGDEADHVGVWGEVCLAERGRIYRVGEPLANCTRGNGRRDSEDLDGDGNLDVREKYLRWVVRLDRASPYLVRTRAETGTGFRLYRIPIRRPQSTQVGGTFGEPDLRSVKNIRLTLVSEGSRSVTVARLRIVGSRWIRRNQEGVLRGIVGDTLSVLGRMEVAPVSRVSEGGAYESPPGVLEQLADPSQAFGGQGIEFNEKSLAIRFDGIQPGDRAEVYNRFPQRPRSFLTYREARLWAVARSGDWGEDRARFFYFKVGSDPENFYLFRTKLGAPADPTAITPADWLPEIVVDFDVWLDLRRQAEEALLVGPRLPGDPPIALWSNDSTYAVVLEDRGRAPDLANVREMAFGVWNLEPSPFDGEVWVDELRLSRGVTDAGLAGHLDVSLEGGDVFDARLTYSSRGALFRELRESPTYQTDQLLSFRSTVRLDRATPSDWGVDLPLTVSYDRASQDPTFIANSDVRGDRLPRLRETGTRQSRVSVGFRKRTPSANPVVGALLDGLEANVGWVKSTASTVSSHQESDGFDARVSYSRRLDPRDWPLIPGFAEPVVRFLLPSFLEEPLVGARLRWTPEALRLGTSYLRRESRISRFERIIDLPGAEVPAPIRAPREFLESSAVLSLRPLRALTVSLTILTTRDLLEPAEAVADPTVRDLLARERLHRFGVDWGWETNRILRTTVGFRPQVLSWLRHEVGWVTSYTGTRNASFVGTSLSADTSLVLLRNASGEREVRALVAVDPAALSLAAFGEPEEGADPRRWTPLPEVLSVLRPVTFSWQSGLSSRFNRDPVEPGASYQLGWGGASSFRLVDSDTAATLTDRTVRRVDWGLALPQGVELGMAWTRTEAATLDVRSDRTILDEIWPDLRATVTSLPVPSPLSRMISRVTLSAGYQERLRQVDFGSLSRQRRAQQDRQVPLDLRLDGQGATTLIYRAAFRVGEGTDPTGATDRDRASHQLAFTSAFTPLGDWAQRLDRPMQLSLLVSHLSERECRAVARRGDCVVFIDHIDRGVGLTLDTGTRGFEVGLQANLTDRQSFVGERRGSTQFQLGLFGRFLLEAGLLPGLQPPGS